MEEKKNTALGSSLKQYYSLCKNLFPINLIYSRGFQHQLYNSDFQIYILDPDFHLDRDYILKCTGNCHLDGNCLSGTQQSHSYPHSFFSCPICFLYYIPSIVDNFNIYPVVQATVVRMDLTCPTLRLLRLTQSSL